jgi:hypothetical protein
VIGVDLANDRHGDCGDAEGANWTGYRGFIETAGKRVLEKAGRDILILVQGIECHNGVTTAWGGNLRAPASGTGMISLGAHSNQLVYAPHEYGPEHYPLPWFCSGQFNYSTWLSQHVERDWLKLQERNVPLIVGSWAKDSVDTDTARIWFTSTIRLINSRNLSHTFWSWSNLFAGWGEEEGVQWNLEVVDAITSTPAEPTDVGTQTLPNCPPPQTVTLTPPATPPPTSTPTQPETPRATLLPSTPPHTQSPGTEKKVGVISMGTMIGLTVGAIGAVIIAIIVIICLFRRSRKDLKDLEQELVESPDREGGTKPQGDQAIQF